MRSADQVGAMVRPLPSSPDWTLIATYAHLLQADRRMFAWEWLRRSPGYRRAWARYSAVLDSPVARRVACRFGLWSLEDPGLDARTARPVWHGACDAHVVQARAARPQAPPGDLFDLLPLHALVTVQVDEREGEHWLFSDGQWLLRLDVVAGTLVGGPALLSFRLAGLAALPPQLESLAQLIELSRSNGGAVPRSSERRASRWIDELRVADALGAGASQREIAQRLFGRQVAGAQWRSGSEAYRVRAQRLVRQARDRLAQPLDPLWFGTRTRRPMSASQPAQAGGSPEPCRRETG